MIEHAAAVELRAEGRTLSGAAMLYGDVAPGYRERFEAGAFETRADPLRLNVQHDKSLTVASTGDVLRIADSARSLDVRAELPPGAAALTLARSGALRGLSVGFLPLREHRDAHGVRVIERAHLDHIALVDRPAYPASTVEVRSTRQALARMAGTMPTGKVSCRCSGVGCRYAELIGEPLAAAIERAFARAVDLVEQEAAEALRSDDFIAVWKDYSHPLASASKGTLRPDPDNPLGFVIDIPDSADGRAVLDAADTAGVIVRPYIENAEGAIRDGDTMRYEGDFDISALIVSSTDARDGWPSPDVTVTGERRAADRRLLLL